MQEALKRAEAYRKAGADAILIHSAKTEPFEIESFCKVKIIVNFFCNFDENLKGMGWETPFGDSANEIL